MTEFNVFFLTKDGRPPTEKFAGRLISQMFKDVDDSIRTKSFAGKTWLDPKRLLTGLEREGNNIVAILTFGAFTSYHMDVLANEGVEKLKDTLRNAPEGKTSWEIAKTIRIP